MSVESGPDVHDGDVQPASQLAAWVAAARRNENFVIGGGVTLGFVTVFMLILHSSTYAVNAHEPVAFGGSLVGLAVSILAATVAVVVFPAWPRRRWRGLAATALALVLVFALLPPITAGYGWLSLVLFAITTVGYEAVVVTWLLIARPWRWMRGLRA